MKYYIYDWYQGKSSKPHEDAVLEELTWYKEVGTRRKPRTEPVTSQLWVIEIDDLHQFVQEWGRAIQLVPPTNGFPLWSVYISDTGRWNMR